jgi:hypothetical protein
MRHHGRGGRFDARAGGKDIFKLVRLRVLSPRTFPTYRECSQFQGKKEEGREHNARAPTTLKM